MDISVASGTGFLTLIFFFNLKYIQATVLVLHCTLQLNITLALPYATKQ